MPVTCLVIALFVVLGRSTVGLGGELVVLSDFPMQILHNLSVHPERPFTPLLDSLRCGRDRAVKPCSSVRISPRDHFSFFDELIEKH
jgi:hypothetical protein